METKKKNSRIVLLTIIVPFVVIAGFLLAPRFFSSNTVRITRVQTECNFYTFHRGESVHSNHHYYHYYTFYFHVDVENSNTSIASNLKIVLDFKVNNNTITSDQRTIRTLEGGESRTVLFRERVPNIQLFDALGNKKGDITAVITLYSGDEMLDQVISGI